MGLKAKIRTLEETNKMLQLRLDICYAALKKIVVEKGKQNIECDEWALELPLVTPESMGQYVLTTVPDDEMLCLTVKKISLEDQDE